jgi:Ca2+-binding EF-hand superfamily protein
MKTKLLIIMPLFLSATLFGASDQKGNNERTNFPIRHVIIKQFDSDGDGKLSMDERSTMRKKMQGKKQEIMQKFDANGDGILNDEERTTIRKAFQNKSEAFESFDADGEEIRDQVETEPNRSSDL